MTSQNTPGVYVEEVVTLGASVASVPTSIPGFAGYTQTAIINGTQWPYTGSAASPAVRITSLREYETIFGGPKANTFTVALSGTSDAPVIAVTPGALGYDLYHHMQMFFANGGGVCYVSSVGDHDDSISATQLNKGIDEFEKVDEVTLLLAPEVMKLGSSWSTVNDHMLAQCATLKDRFCIFDVPDTAASTASSDASTFRGSYVGASNLSYGAAYYPALVTSLPYYYADTNVTISSDSLNGTSYATKTLDVLKNGVSGFPAINGLYNRIKAELNKQTITLYPSSAMAGIYARVDGSRGVWKAPANVGVTMVSAPLSLVNDADQSGLNIDSSSGKSINVIRQFTGKGTIVWGGRTLAGNDNEWKYVNVRRLFIYVEESIKKATEFVVFEPNTAATWSRVKSMCEAFLTGLWRDGALAGATAKEAFFVRVGLGSTMNSDDVLNGRMIIEIGLAASRPAEFIILKFSHKIQES